MNVASEKGLGTEIVMAKAWRDGNYSSFSSIRFYDT
jgi:hypothetical protein